MASNTKESMPKRIDRNAPYIRLTNVKDNTQVWELSLGEDIIIGRETDCHIYIEEKSVARQQCRIYTDGAVLIENISRTNITQLNGTELKSPAELNWGDRLTCGRVILSVETLMPFYTNNHGDLNMLTEFANV